MRLIIDGEEYEARVQKRQVTYVDILKSGRHLSRGEAILNPLDMDVESDEEGIKLAAERALKSLVPIIPKLRNRFYRFYKGITIVRKYRLAKLRPVIETFKRAERALSIRIGKLRAHIRQHKQAQKIGVVSVDAETHTRDQILPTGLSIHYCPDFEGTTPKSRRR